MQPQITPMTQKSSNSYLRHLRNLWFLSFFFFTSAVGEQPATTRALERWPIEYRHEVRQDQDATASAVGMLFWFCGTSKFFAGQRGKPSRHPVKRRATSGGAQ